MGEIGVSKPRGRIARRKQSGALVRAEARGLPTIYLSHLQNDSAAAALPRVYLSETGDHGAVGRLKWLASTCVAGAVALGLIGIAVYASMNMGDGSGILSSIRQASRAALRPLKTASIAHDRQSPTDLKGDLIETTSAGFINRQIIHQRVVEHQDGREFIAIKPYIRLIVGLSTNPPPSNEKIPPFDPFKLYADATPVGAKDNSGNQHLSTTVVSLPVAALDNDGVKLTDAQAARLVRQAAENYAAAEHPFKMAANSATPGFAALQNASYHPDNPGSPLTHNMTTIGKTMEASDDDGADDPSLIDGSKTEVERVKRGNRLISIIEKAGVDRTEARAIIAAFRHVFSPRDLSPGQRIAVTLVPTAHDIDSMRPIKVSIFSPANEHLATAVRTKSGAYVASKKPLRAALDGGKASIPDDRATLYQSFYEAALKEQLPRKVIMQLLRIESYDVDFKQQVNPGDTFEAFFESPRNGNDATAVGPLLYASMTIDNVTHSFYRFRTPDGVVDYYDKNGNSAKKFLMRDPVRGGRFSSGFGMRFHPILHVWRMHDGVDWAAPIGTPIMAAGDGVVVFAGRRGGYGNYVRLRHANGFQTGYGHMLRFAKGLKPGVHVKQGQIIGYVGSTGISTGPHCHFEVLVDRRYVNPMTIHVPHGRQLKGRMLAEFERERLHINALMQMDPVTNQIAANTKTAD